MIICKYVEKTFICCCCSMVVDHILTGIFKHALGSSFEASSTARHVGKCQAHCDTRIQYILELTYVN